jgi:hypothetical protein
MYVAPPGGACGARLKIVWVKSGPNLPFNPSSTTTSTPSSTSTSTSTTTTTIAPSCANGRAACALGDTGPGGGKVFYIDTANEFDWNYLEAAPSDWNNGLAELINWTCVAEASTPTATGREIGDGRANTLSMSHAITSCGAASYVAGELVPDLTYGGKSDWFVPSIGELEEMANQTSALGLGISTQVYWSSTQSTLHDDYAVAYDVSSQSELQLGKGLGLLRPIRAFGGTCAYGGTCALGDMGPGGGRVFFVDSAEEYPSFDYMEIAPSSWNGASELTGSWCSNDNETEFGGTSWGIGAGKTNFEVMVANCTGIADAVDEYVSEYLGLRLSDWFIPSDEEINTAYTALNSSGQWPGDGTSWYWSSTEAGFTDNNARIFISDFGVTQSTWKGTNGAKVIPIREF